MAQKTPAQVPCISACMEKKEPRQSARTKQKVVQAIWQSVVSQEPRQTTATVEEVLPQRAKTKSGTTKGPSAPTLLEEPGSDTLEAKGTMGQEPRVLPSSREATLPRAPCFAYRLSKEHSSAESWSQRGNQARTVAAPTQTLQFSVLLLWRQTLASE